MSDTFLSEIFFYCTTCLTTQKCQTFLFYHFIFVKKSLNFVKNIFILQIIYFLLMFKKYKMQAQNHHIILLPPP